MSQVFTIKLFQSHIQRSNTENFQIEAETEEEARNRAVKMIEEEKGITEDYDIEVEAPVDHEAERERILAERAAAEGTEPKAAELDEESANGARISADGVDKDSSDHTEATPEPEQKA